MGYGLILDCILALLYGVFVDVYLCTLKVYSRLARRLSDKGIEHLSLTRDVQGRKE